LPEEAKGESVVEHSRLARWRLLPGWRFGPDGCRYCARGQRYDDRTGEDSNHMGRTVSMGADGKTTVLLSAFPVFAFPQRGAVATSLWKDTGLQATPLANA
jgi:hypothetical protein